MLQNIRQLGIKIFCTTMLVSLVLSGYLGFALAEEGVPPVVPTTCEELTEEECAGHIDDWECKVEEESCVTNIDLTEPSDVGDADLQPQEEGKINKTTKLQITAPGETDNWLSNPLQTFGVQFLIRSKEALAWALQINEYGFGSEAIKTSYLKILTIVNSLFVLGMLVIAAMWMLSMVVPRAYLKKVMLFYAGAVILVNFALPLTQLMIDGANLLQQTFLTDGKNQIEITQIIQMDEGMNYNNVKVYQTEFVEENSGKTYTLQIGGNVEGEEDTLFPIGTIESGNKDETEILIKNDSVIGDSLITLPKAEPQTLNINKEELQLKLSSANPTLITEAVVFEFVMMMITSIAYFLLALIFVVRIIILWALLIVSPALFILAVFPSTRSWFYNWLNLYGRWLLIGPLVALGISVIINIWQTVGLPIGSSYEESVLMGSKSNLSFLLPGKTEVSSFQDAGEMMEYIVFLIMLYLPIFFGFALTRQKAWAGVTNHVSTKWNQISKNKKLLQILSTQTTETKTSETKTESRGMTEQFKDVIGAQVSKFTQATMPSSVNKEVINSTTTSNGYMIPSASSFLPESLALNNVDELLELVGKNKESKSSHQKVIEKLANPEKIKDQTEQKHAKAVHEELTTRAKKGDSKAIRLINEVNDKQSDSLSNKNVTTNNTTQVNNSSEVHSDKTETLHETTIAKEVHESVKPAEPHSVGAADLQTQAKGETNSDTEKVKEQINEEYEMGDEEDNTNDKQND